MGCGDPGWAAAALHGQRGYGDPMWAAAVAWAATPPPAADLVGPATPPEPTVCFVCAPPLALTMPLPFVCHPIAAHGSDRAGTADGQWDTNRKGMVRERAAMRRQRDGNGMTLGPTRAADVRLPLVPAKAAAALPLISDLAQGRPRLHGRPGDKDPPTADGLQRNLGLARSTPRPRVSRG